MGFMMMSVGKLVNIVSSFCARAHATTPAEARAPFQSMTRKDPPGSHAVVSPGHGVAKQC